MGGTSRKKCKGFIPCLINPLHFAATCFSCKQYGGPRPPVPRVMPGHDPVTAWDEPPKEDAVETACAYCGRLFYAPKNKKYCCRSCSKKAYRRRRAERGNQNKQFDPRTCVICGNVFYPRTDFQQTCGGLCNKKFMAKKYGVGVPKNYPAEIRKSREHTMETRANSPAHHLRECVEQIKRHNPDAAVSPSSLDALAAMLSARLPWLKTISRPRQAVLLDIAVSYGVHGLFSMERLLSFVRAGRWEQARQILLNSRYAMHMASNGCGKACVENARQLLSGAWTVIPEYIPGEDDEDEEEDDGQLWL